MGSHRLKYRPEDVRVVILDVETGVRELRGVGDKMLHYEYRITLESTNELFKIFIMLL